MKVFSKIMIAFLAITLVIACKNTPEGEAAKTGDAATNVATASATAKNFSVTDGQFIGPLLKLADSTPELLMFKEESFLSKMEILPVENLALKCLR